MRGKDENFENISNETSHFSDFHWYTGDATENVSQFIMAMKSVNNKNYILKKKMYFKHSRKAKVY